ncbi:MAG TPA: hypothetical protein P5569_12330, partial [Candidatus Latescibacteria bacterium]|nr:hypothetical protein [Candidatus Latescibacterota bacterium]
VRGSWYLTSLIQLGAREAFVRARELSVRAAHPAKTVAAMSKTPIHLIVGSPLVVKKGPQSTA